MGTSSVAPPPCRPCSAYGRLPARARENSCAPGRKGASLRPRAPLPTSGYKILYMYKIKEGLVPNLPINPFNPETSFGLEFSSNPRTGCRCSIPEQILYHNPAEIPRNSSFALTATNLWNCLPPSLSLISNKSVDYFKKQLDKFLDIFPDEPRCSASGQYYDPNTGRTTNSIWHLQSDPSIKMEINAYSKRLKYAESMQGRASSR